MVTARTRHYVSGLAEQCIFILRFSNEHQTKSFSNSNILEKVPAHR
jgi:hypothetical protein